MSNHRNGTISGRLSAEVIFHAADIDLDIYSVEEYHDTGVNSTGFDPELRAAASFAGEQIAISTASRSLLEFMGAQQASCPFQEAEQLDPSPLLIPTTLSMLRDMGL